MSGAPTPPAGVPLPACPAVPLTATAGQASSGTLLVLALGFFSQLAQILVFRELMALCHGAELLFGVVLASSLVWTAVGSALAIWLAQASQPCSVPREQAGSCATGLALCVAAGGPLLVGEIVLARVLAGWGAVAAGQAPAFAQSAALAALVTAPAALVSGALFVLALKSFPALPFRAVYLVESCGAVLGGLVFTFPWCIFWSRCARRHSMPCSSARRHITAWWGGHLACPTRGRLEACPTNDGPRAGRWLSWPWRVVCAGAGLVYRSKR